MKSTSQQKITNSCKCLLTILFTGLLFITNPTQSIAAPPSPIGAWNLAGVDEASNNWIATVVLFHNINNVIVGYADWSADTGFGGREFLTATYNETNRILKFHGIKLKYPDGIVRGSYRATLSLDGNKLLNGKWSDFDPTIPGKWVANRIQLK